MKRLREVTPSSPLLQRAQELLQSTPPLPESRERMLRVRRALDEPRGLLASLRRLPAMAAAALIVLFGASAFAAVRIYEAVSAGASESGAPSEPAQRRRARPSQPAVEAPTGQAPEAAADEVGAAEPADANADERAQSPAGTKRAAHAAARARKDDGASTEAETVAKSSDSDLVHRAVKALRRDRDPALATRLLEAHHARAPEGPLAEEALSLRIEAALALRSPKAPVLAREYLARYPGGRYAAIAHRALKTEQ